MSLPDRCLKSYYKPTLKVLQHQHIKQVQSFKSSVFLICLEYHDVDMMWTLLFNVWIIYWNRLFFGPAGAPHCPTTRSPCQPSIKSLPPNFARELFQMGDPPGSTLLCLGVYATLARSTTVLPMLEKVWTADKWLKGQFSVTQLVTPGPMKPLDVCQAHLPICKQKMMWFLDKHEVPRSSHLCVSYKIYCNTLIFPSKIILDGF